MPRARSRRGVQPPTVAKRRTEDDYTGTLPGDVVVPEKKATASKSAESGKKAK